VAVKKRRGTALGVEYWFILKLVLDRKQRVWYINFLAGERETARQVKDQQVNSLVVF
jgi:hypothetical protein